MCVTFYYYSTVEMLGKSPIVILLILFFLFDRCLLWLNNRNVSGKKLPAARQRQNEADELMELRRHHAALSYQGLLPRLLLISFLIWAQMS